MFAILNGRFVIGKSSAEIRVEQMPPTLAHLRSDISPELDLILQRMMAKNPVERFQTPAEVAQALTSYADTQQSAAAPPQPPNRTKRSILMTAMVLLAGILIYLATDTGKLEVDTTGVDIPGARIVLLKGGQEYASFRVNSEQKVQSIWAGEYEVQLRNAPDDVKFNVWSKPGDTNEWGGPDAHELEPIVVYRGGEMMIQVKRRIQASVPPMTSSGQTIHVTVRPETRQKLKDLVNAARKASTDEDWEKVLTMYAPVLATTAETTDHESEKFGATEMAQMQNGVLTLVKLLAGLPDEVHEDLLATGYLKWRFRELDDPRQTAMKNALMSVFSASSKMGFPSDLKAQVPNMLASGDVGFTVVDIPEGQGLVWHLQIPEAPIPIMLPIFSLKQGDEEAILSASVYQQIGRLVELPFSALPQSAVPVTD